MKTTLTIFDSEGNLYSETDVERKQDRITTGLHYSLKDALSKPDWQRFITTGSDVVEGSIYEIRLCLNYKGNDYFKQVSLTNDAVFNMSEWITQEGLMENVSELFYDMLISDILEDTQEAS